MEKYDEHIPNSVVIGGASQTAIYPSVLGNPNLTWAQCLNYNIGVDVTLWNGLLGMELDAFINMNMTNYLP